MKKIAFIIPHLTNGGAERTISNLSFALEKHFDISIIVFDGNNVTYPYKGKLYDVGLPPVEGTFAKLLTSIKRIKAVRKIRREQHFDCVISFMFGANIVNVLSKQKEKTIISARNLMSAYSVSFRTMIGERITAYLSDVDVALSKVVELDLKNKFKVDAQKLVTIYNPCDVDNIYMMSQEECEYEFIPGTFYIVTAGRFVVQKGQWHLIKAFSVFLKDNPQSRLLILGDGVLKDDLVKLCQDLNVIDNVDFLGFVDNPYKYISRCNCFVLPSLYEGLGNVIIEAMACGIPVVSADCQAGPRELLSPDSSLLESSKGVEWHSCGILIPPFENGNPNFDCIIEKNDKLLAESLVEIKMHPESCSDIVVNASNRIKELSPTSIAQKWIGLINS